MFLVKVVAPVLVTTGKGRDPVEGTVFMETTEFVYTFRLLEVCRFKAVSMRPAKREGFTLFIKQQPVESGKAKIIVRDGHYVFKEVK